MTMIEEYKNEITKQIANTDTLNTLLSTTFKGLTGELAKQALLEGMMRGFTIKDFLQKDIYAIPFKEGYSLINSVGYVRKIGMRSGIVGKSAPIYEEQDGRIISCTITVKRKVNEYVGEYTATCFFNEYTTGRNLWISKPKMMIAKVTEMAAIRMACPEELSETYIEEEMGERIIIKETVDFTEFENKLNGAKSYKELSDVWVSLPAEAKTHLLDLKDNLKKKYENTTVSNDGGMVISEESKDNGK